MKEDPVVMVPVPQSLLPEVYELLARCTARRYSDPRVVAPHMVAERIAQAPQTLSREFSPAELGLLKRRLESSNPARILLDLCASKAGARVDFKDVVSASLLEERQVRGQLGALTKHLNKLFNDRRWPVEVISGAQGQTTYIMSEDTSRIWREL